ncbi:hypothetical protein BLA29_008050 [Euroglyphus maynei]|uniref:SWIM-type domain-containing protein n=1 Tax=Euroglyphus maynei TaxID=6958 RepID=A0A1Y3ASQ6_EURMA|nr:hypothetical protein BLA29_008050 [Euroglyphus maynei]
MNRGYIPTKLRYLRKKHSDSKKYPLPSLKEIINYYGVITLKYWSDEKKHNYIISINHNHEPDCDLKCDECNLCLCQVSCNCEDYVIRNNFCLHIHLAYRAYVSLQSPEKNIELELENDLNPPDILDQTISITYENDSYEITKTEDVSNKRLKAIENKSNEKNPIGMYIMRLSTFH